MKTWEQAHAEKWASMSEAERAEYEAVGPEVELELRAAEVIYQARHEAALTQAQLAERAGMNQTYVSALENGTRTPTIGTLARVVAAAGKKLTLSVSD